MQAINRIGSVSVACAWPLATQPVVITRHSLYGCLALSQWGVHVLLKSDLTVGASDAASIFYTQIQGRLALLDNPACASKSLLLKEHLGCA